MKWKGVSNMANRRFLLTRQFPRLNKQNILRYIVEHNNTFAGSETTEFLQLIMGPTGDRIINMLEKEKDLKISLGPNTPTEILSNERFMKLAIRSNFKNFYVLPENLITPSLYQIFEDCFVAEPPRVRSPLPKNLLKYMTPKVLKHILFNTTTGYFDIVKEVYETRPQFFEEVLAANPGEFSFYYLDFDYFPDSLKGQEFFIKQFRALDLKQVIKVYELNPQLGHDTFLRLMKHNAIYTYDRKEKVFSDLFNNKEIIDAIFANNADDYYDFSKIKMEYFSKENLEKYLKRNRASIRTYGESPMPMGFSKSKEGFEMALNMGLEPICFHALFTSTALKSYYDNITNFGSFPDEKRDYSLSILKYMSANGTTNFIENASLLKDILTMFFANTDLFLKSGGTLRYFDVNSFSKDVLDVLISNQSSYYFGPIITSLFTYSLFLDKENSPVNYLIENLYYENLQYLLTAHLDRGLLVKVLSKNIYIDETTDINIDILNDPIILELFIKSGCVDRNFKILSKFEHSLFTENIINLLRFDIFYSMPQSYLAPYFMKMLPLYHINEENIDGILQIFIDSSMDEMRDYATLLWVISECRKKNIKNEKLNQLTSEIVPKLHKMIGEIVPIKVVNDYVERVLKGERSSFSLLYAKTMKSFKVATYFDDVLSPEKFEYIDTNIPSEVVNNVNTKHIKIIMSLLDKRFDFGQEDNIQLALNIYTTLGFERAISFLALDKNKNYGPVDCSQLHLLFDNVDLYEILFKKVDGGFEPVINETLVNLIFGKNNKEKNTPIRNYLGLFVEKREEIKRLIKKVEDDPNIEPGEKEARIHRYEEQLQEYQNNVNEIMEHLGRIFNEWDIIEEEFIKMASNSKLKLKLNIESINIILNRINTTRKLCSGRYGITLDEFIDAKLMATDIFEHAGYDRQFTACPERAPARAIELSRAMEGKYTKKFPNTTVTDGEYTMRFFHPQDRHILSVGYHSHCCFRPNGNADNEGKDGSLLQYATTNEYGGGVEIIDKNGNIVMFSPIFRNGNVLMLHSIETEIDTKVTPFPEKCTQLIKKFSEQVIQDSKNSGDNIEFVVISDLHYLDTRITEGVLYKAKRFTYYDPNSEYSDMYTNLPDTGHHLLAHADGKVIEDIEYGPVEHTYEYGKEDLSFVVDIDPELLNKCLDLENLKAIINVTANKRKQSEGVKDEFDYMYLEEIKKYKKAYLEMYRNLLSDNKSSRFYRDINHVMSVMSAIKKEASLSSLSQYESIIYGVNWFIAITKDKKVVCDALPSGLEEMKINLLRLKNTTNLLIEENVQK